MNIKSTIVSSAAALALGAVVVNSSAAPALASEESSPSHIAQIAAATEAVEAVEAEPLAGWRKNALHITAHVVTGFLGGRAADSTTAVAAMSDALFDYR